MKIVDGSLREAVVKICYRTMLNDDKATLCE